MLRSKGVMIRYFRLEKDQTIAALPRLVMLMNFRQLLTHLLLHLYHESKIHFQSVCFRPACLQMRRPLICGACGEHRDPPEPECNIETSPPMPSPASVDPVRETNDPLEAELDGVWIMNSPESDCLLDPELSSIDPPCFLSLSPPKWLWRRRWRPAWWPLPGTMTKRRLGLLLSALFCPRLGAVAPGRNATAQNHR